MEKNKNRSAMFQYFIPELTESDLKWKEKVTKKSVKYFKRRIRSLGCGNYIWRLNHIAERFPSEINVSKVTGLDGFAFDKGYKSVLGAVVKNDCINEKSLGIALYVMEHFKGVLDNIDHTFQHVCYDNNVVGMYIILNDVSCTQEKKDLFLKRVVTEGRANLLPAFLEHGLISVNDNNIRPLLTAVQNRSMDRVLYFVNMYDADISMDDYLVIKEANRIAAYDIQYYLEEKAGVKLENNGDIVKIDSTDKSDIQLFLEDKTDEIDPNNETGVARAKKWKKISDDEIMEFSSSDDDTVILTRLFNFLSNQVTQTQYIKDINCPPISVICNFKDIEKQTFLKEAFDKLIELDGHPEQDMFKHSVPFIQR